MGKAWVEIHESRLGLPFGASAMTHAKLRHIRRCNRAKVYRQFWPRR